MNDPKGTVSRRYTIITRNGREVVDAEVIDERLVSFFVNGQELATIMATPSLQDAHAIGFMANEGMIDSLDEVRAVHICPSGACVDVWLDRAEFTPPKRMILTSGCGGGVTFEDMTASYDPVKADARVTPEQLWAMMDLLNQAADLYSRARGVHTAALSDGERLLIKAEDVGRHNTLDKVRGLALMEGIETEGRILLSTGRISSEMINKARRMGAPIVASRTSPTNLSIRLAEEWRITLVGYLRRNSMNVYTHPQRALEPEASAAAPNGRQRQ